MASCVTYLQAYPTGSFTYEALDYVWGPTARLGRFARTEDYEFFQGLCRIDHPRCTEVDELLSHRALSRNSGRSDLSAFLDEYPNSSHRTQVMQWLWDSLRRFESVDKYRWFLERYSDSPFAEEAKRRLASMEERARNSWAREACDAIQRNDRPRLAGMRRSGFGPNTEFGSGRTLATVFTCILRTRNRLPESGLIEDLIDAGVDFEDHRHSDMIAKLIYLAHRYENSFRGDEDKQQTLLEDIRLLAAAGAGYDGVLDAVLKHSGSPVHSKLLAIAFDGIDDCSGDKFGDHLVDSSSFNRVETVRYLLNCGADPNKPSSSFKRLALGAAVEHRVHEDDHAKRLATVRLLIERGAEIDALSGIYQYTPLVYAAQQGDLELMELLLDSGADVNFKTPGGLTPLLAAVDFPPQNPTEGGGRSLRAVRLLVECGADVNFEQAGELPNWTPLKSAIVTYKNAEVAAYLLLNGATNLGDGIRLDQILRKRILDEAQN